MARKLGQIIAVREPTWITRIPLARDPETKQRNYNNRTIHASLRRAQKFFGKKIIELGAKRVTLRSFSGETPLLPLTAEPMSIKKHGSLETGNSQSSATPLVFSSTLFPHDQKFQICPLHPPE